MKNKIKRILCACLTVLSICFFIVSVEAAPGGNWWDKFGEPQYGGTLTFALPGLMAFNVDVYNFMGGENNFYYEALFEPDWVLDRNIWDMKTNFIPDEYWKGNLAESWEMPDGQTIIAHIRKGAKWQNKPPVNGREFTAYDVQAHYDRILGTGGGYTWKAPIYAGMTANWEKVTATDKYTVVFKFKNASAQIFQSIADRWSLNVFEAPEYVALGGPPEPPPSPPGGEKKGGPPEGGGGPPPVPDFGHGPTQDWHNAIGTGPWIMENYVDGSAFHYARNPDYWGHDPRHPENQVPYADKLDMLVIPDYATRVAAVRTGKIDILQSGNMSGIDWQQAAILKKSNPDFVQSRTPAGAGGIGFRIDKKPFTDIRVRKAMNMAIDRKAIAKSIFGGTVEGKPVGFITSAFKGYAYDYNDWPQSLKDEYAYNPEGAKKLLAEAGYPNGFKTNVVTSTIDATALSVLQVFKDYFQDIGIDMEIRAMDSMAAQAFTRAGKHDQLSAQGGGFTFPPTRAVDLYYSKGTDAVFYGVNDAKYDELRDKFWAAVTPDEAKKIFQELDKYVTEQHWNVVASESYVYNIWHPYLKGYSGESLFWGQGIMWSRLWIDKSLKK